MIIPYSIYIYMFIFIYILGSRTHELIINQQGVRPQNLEFAHGFTSRLMIHTELVPLPAPHEGRRKSRRLDQLYRSWHWFGGVLSHGGIPKSSIYRWKIPFRSIWGCLDGNLHLVIETCERFHHFNTFHLFKVFDKPEAQFGKHWNILEPQSREARKVPSGNLT